VNRATPFDILMSRPALSSLDLMLPEGAQNYRITIIGNSPGTPLAVETVRMAAGATSHARPLQVEYPGSFFSLSHVALPFPCSDSLYGTEPEAQDFGVHLGIQSPRGERGTLLRGADTLVRASCNPFYGYLAARVEENLGR
jgi:hypothetical protein